MARRSRKFKRTLGGLVARTRIRAYNGIRRDGKTAAKAAAIANAGRTAAARSAMVRKAWGTRKRGA